MKKIAKAEKGLSSILITAIIVVILAVAGVVIWQVTKKSPTSNTAATNTASTTSAANANISSACLKIFNDDKLCAFAEHTDIETIEYVATGTAVNGSGTSGSFTVQHDSSNNSSIVYTTSSKQLSEINFDGATYVQNGSGTTWYEYTTSNQASAAGIPNPVSSFELKFNTGNGNGYTAIKDGTAPCGNLTCYKYQVKVASSPDTTQYVWFDTKDYLLREFSYNDSSTGISADINFSYQSVKIAAPSPVQVVS
jgi:outer membrane lipoprotein-sorting protein